MTSVIFIYLSLPVKKEQFIMKLPCEVAVRSVVPAIRALLAKELTKTHKLNQSEAANLLGITQTAISKYVNLVRGHTLSIENERTVRVMIESTATALVNGELKPKKVRLQICNVCRLVREKGLMCDLCKRINMVPITEECNLCFSHI
jgi:predicted transcriptional regulator